MKSSTDPVSNVSYRYASLGKPREVTSEGAVFSMTYDDRGLQRTLTDPNAGTTTYTYNSIGQLTRQVDGRGKATDNVYDDFGRMSTSTVGGTTTTYTYGMSGNETFRLVKQQTGDNYVEYVHDNYGRVATENRQVAGESLLSFGYQYNSLGQLSGTSYPGGLSVGYTYDAYGNKESTSAGSQPIWQLAVSNGTATVSRLGGTLTWGETCDSKGLLTNLKMLKDTQVLHNMDFVFDGATGNLSSRTGMIAQAETFGYDNLDRLTDVSVGGNNAMHLGYAANGNISSKTGIGAYSYGSKPHAVTGVENTGGLISSSTLSTPFNAFNKVDYIADAGSGYRLDFTYGPDQERWKTVLKQNGNTVKTTIFAGDYEQVTAGGATQRLYYLDGGAIYVKQDGQADKVYYACTDHLGSVVKLVDGAGAEVFAATYDAWGKRTVTNNTFAFHRGFTGHEHLPEFDLINMNGRLYDPAIGRFLSCDPYVQMPDFSQNFNRYSYCLNNPLKYNDPSGELFYIFPYIGWSPNGGFNIGISAGIGLPGAASVGVNVGYNTGNHSWSFTANASLAGAYVYAGYNTKAGFMAGAGYNMYSFNPGGFGFSSNLTSVGIDYSQHGGVSMSMMGAQMSEAGVTFDPSISGGYTLRQGTSISEISEDIGVVYKEDAETSTNMELYALFLRNGIDPSKYYTQKVDIEDQLPLALQAKGYKRIGGMIFNSEGDIGGVTVSYFNFFKRPTSQIFMSTHNTNLNLMKSLNHEFIHSWQYARFGHKMKESEWNSFKEASAYRYTKLFYPSIRVPEYRGFYNSFLYTWPVLPNVNMK